MPKTASTKRGKRPFKSYEQTASPGLPKLDRASIHAHKEGRAEPKIDTYIDVANYFSTTIATYSQKIKQ
jgi:hypothetical protein